MLDSKASQFSLSPEGQILWQEKLNNPVPGVAVALLKKGAHPLKPEIEVIECDETKKYDATAVLNALKIWFKTHLSEVLEPLVLLEEPLGTETKDDPVSQIAAKVYDGMGIVPREELEEMIAQLSTETRADLRAKKIRLGPILAFIPALNKPAAVKLRAVLWSLYNDAVLPAKTPADGIVSVRLEDENPNEQYYRAIGYPYYGGRVVRIDMLDRVICCVYDHAKDGKFQARHEMAEWLGSSIEDLYKVLEAMGHKKIYDPAEAALAEEDASEKPAEDNKPEAAEEQSAENKEPAAKPELATFRLKKGKAYSKGGERGKKTFFKDDRKPAKKKDFKKKGKGGAQNKKSDAPRVISVEAKKKEEDSPFAILQQLKK